jgi:beta-lactamase regulating signal transducer with metallopeptidase domain
MATLLNSVVLNGAVASGLALVIWGLGAIPTIHRRPGLRHALWIVVLLKLVTPPIFNLSILPAWFAIDSEPFSHSPAIPLGNLSGLLTAPTALDELSSREATSYALTIDWLVAVAAVGGMGTLTVLAYAMRQVWQLRRALRRSESDDKRLNEIARRAAEHMGLPVLPSVSVVAANVSPLLWVRWSGPLIVVPRRFANQLSDDQLSCILSHEIAHYLRRDHWTNLLSLLVAAACWWNPVVWWARRELRTAQEACCDALVISQSVASRKTYAETLFQALEFLHAERSLMPALASGFGGKSSTERRFEMIANPRVNHRLSWWSYPVLLSALAALPCLPSRTNAEESDVEFVGSVVDFDQDGLLDFYLSDVDKANSGRVLFRDGDAGKSDTQLFRLDATRALAGDQGRILLLTGVSISLRQTDRRTYRVQRSERGLVVLAFDRETKKLAWSSEIELPQPDQAVAGQRFLLHTGGGFVTIAVVAEDKSLAIQELDATTGNVVGECQLVQLDSTTLSVPDGGTVLLGGIKRLQELSSTLRIRLRPKPESAAGALLRLTPKRIGNDLVIQLGAVAEGHLTVETAGTVWRLVNGDAPIETVRMIRDGDNPNPSLIIEGKAGKHERIILQVESESEERSLEVELKSSTPPDGASSAPAAEDPLVEAAK